MKTQKVDLFFEKNGTNWGLVKDYVKHTIDLPLPDGFESGVHLTGAKTADKIIIEDGNSTGSEKTGWVTMVAEVITDRDIERIVGKVLTVVDATIADREQREAFKSLMKQAIYGYYNKMLERSYQIAQEPPVLMGTPDY
jgi:hypothetical protein